MTSVSTEVSGAEGVDTEAPWREKAEVEGSSAVVAEDVHNAASQEEVIAHMEGMVHKVEASRDCDIVVEGIVADSSSRGKVACSHCTSAQLEDTAGSGCKVSSFPYLAAYSAALPADDDRSSCRLGRCFQTDRVLASDWELRVAVVDSRCRR